MYYRNLSLRRRPAAALIENAFVLSVLFFLLVGITIGGISIMRYQEVAALAREGARWASVHGGQYQAETGKAAATQASIDTYIRSLAVGLDPHQLQPTVVTWNTSNMPTRYNPNSNPPGQLIANTVSVTVNYTWSPGLILNWLGTITLTSTSVMPMEY